jgi:cation transport regulator ChaB
MRVDYEKLNDLTRSIYAAAFVRALDEKRLRAGSRERKAAGLAAHEFAVAAVDAFTGATATERSA